MWVKRRGPYLLIVHDAWSDLRSLVTWRAFNSQRSLVERLSRNAIVRQLNVDWILYLEEKAAMCKKVTRQCTVYLWIFLQKYDTTHQQIVLFVMKVGEGEVKETACKPHETAVNSKAKSAPICSEGFESRENVSKCLVLLQQ